MFARKYLPACENNHFTTNNSYKHLTHSLHRGLIILDNNLTIIEFNNVAERIMGVSAKQVVGKIFQQAFAQNVNLLVLDYIIKQNQVKGLEINYCQEGIERQLIMDGNRFIIDKDKPAGYVFVFLDKADDELTTQEKIELLQQQYAFTLETISRGVMAVDINYRITIYNQAAEKIFGLPVEKVYGRNLFDVFPEESKEELVFYITLQGTEFVNKYHESIYNGKLCKFIVDSKIIFNQQGQKIGAVMIFNDISEYKALQEKANKVNQMERQQEQIIAQHESLASIGRLAAGLAHEIRNPLTSIRGFVQLLQNKLKEGTETEYLDIILEELDRTNKLLSDFMFLAKPRKGIFKDIDLRSLLLSTIDFMKGQAVLNDVELKHQIPTELPKIKGDEEQLKQVFINMLRNGIEAISEKGDILVKAELVEKEIKISFADSGVGIPAENLGQIFNMLYTTKETGTGLGLSVCSQIIKHHEGRIEVESQEGSGSTFTIILPYK